MKPALNFYVSAKVGKAGLMNMATAPPSGSRQPVLQAAQWMKLCVSLLTWRLDVVLGAKTQALPLPEIHLFKVLLK
jgi:hypothetical protein